MALEQSFGIIPLRRRKGSWEVFLIQHHAGHWGVPKGHPELNETPQQTASRELTEETGLDVLRFLDHHPLEEGYWFTREGEKVHKTVQYFVAEVQGNVVLQEEELLEGKWVPLEKAERHMTFPEGKKLCRLVNQIVVT